MTRRIRDISPPVSLGSDVWPGDTPFTFHRVMSVAEGMSCNVTTVNTTVHVGAHADAPLHFVDGAADVASVDLAAYVGRARVVKLPRRGAVTAADVAQLDLAGVERLLIATRSVGEPSRFADGFSYLDPAGARTLGASGLRLVGIDTFSVDAENSKTLDSHKALLSARCAILEGLDLSEVPAGDYELIALPLKLVGCDASPVRAILRDLA